MFINNKAPELTMGQKLKMFREINNLSQEELGQKLNVSDKTISAWETGERDINLANAKLICELFDIPNSYFVFNENFENIPSEHKPLIQEYIKTTEFRNNIETIKSNCKQKIENDGLPLKKEYLPVFDYEKNTFSHYGIFDAKTLPISIKSHTDSLGKHSFYSVSFNKDISNTINYKYSSSALVKYGLYELLEKYNNDTVELKDLISCNNLEIFKSTLSKMKQKKYTKQKLLNPYEYVDISEEVLQNQLNEVLENLSPCLSNFWEIIVFLIDNGAYYTKQYGWGDDVVSWSNIKDISKTNLTYRHAKDKMEK